MKILHFAALAALTSLGLASPAHAQTAPYRLLHTIAVGGEGGWDYLTVDPAGERLYLSHGTQVEVVDLKTRKVIGTIPNTPGVHGIDVVPGANRGYITCGRNNTCVMFDLKTLKAIGAPIPTGPKPDALLYDAFSNRVFLFSNDGGKSTVLNATTGAVEGTAELGGDIEAPATDGKGHIFANVEDKSEVIEFDAKTLAVHLRHKLAPGEEPTGLGYDPKNNRLFSACHNEKLVVTDSKTGQQIAVLPIGAGVDGAVFDPSTQNIVTSNGSGTFTVIHQDSPTNYTVVANVPTAKGARTIALDPKSHHLFTCTADYGPTPAATAENPRPRPSIVPGTFRVLEFGR
ncbi:PQQ-binding-like beta-propeller repeat protein [Hymenobacter sp. BRD128]|uniref:YncE family protein n=1 Tax=Hymenobacter sp. BRD128 TaxID=2675878 RepID=UPI0015652E6E|nr:PQQ-binding-like beta-propeller repeat protein [Hymenobacter sp. BRD128]QKG57533.1 PQQ-binding-like beta-propeller repeat protein [Hymenobacter sp. BRD128]